MNIQEIKKNLKDIDKNIFKIIRNGVKFSFYFCILASMILLWYCLDKSPNVFYIGISLFKSSLFYIVGFIIFGLSFSKISKDLTH